MLLYNELNFKEPIKIFDKYAEYPKIIKILLHKKPVYTLEKLLHLRLALNHH